MSEVQANTFPRQVQFKTPRMDCPTSQLIVREFSPTDTKSGISKNVETGKQSRSGSIFSKFEVSNNKHTLTAEDDKGQSKKKSIANFFKLKDKKSKKSSQKSDDSDYDDKTDKRNISSPISGNRRIPSSDSGSTGRVRSGDSSHSNVKMNVWNVEDISEAETKSDSKINKKKTKSSLLPKSRHNETLVLAFDEEIPSGNKKTLSINKRGRSPRILDDDEGNYSSHSELSHKREEESESEDYSPQVMVSSRENVCEPSPREKQARILDSSDEDEHSKMPKKKKAFLAKSIKSNASNSKATSVTQVIELNPMEDSYCDSDEFTRDTLFPSKPWSPTQYHPDIHSEMLFLKDDTEDQFITGKELTTFLADSSLSASVLVVDAREFQDYERSHLLFAQHCSQFENTNRQMEFEDIDEVYILAVLYDSDSLALSIRSSKISQCYDALKNAGIRTFTLKDGFEGIKKNYPYLLSSKSPPVLPIFFDHEKIGLIHTNATNLKDYITHFKTRKIVSFNSDSLKGLPSHIEIYQMKAGELSKKLEKVLLFILHNFKSHRYNTMVCYIEESAAVCLLLGYLMCRYHWSINSAYTYALEFRSKLELSKEHFKLLQKYETNFFGKILSKNLEYIEDKSKNLRLLSAGSDKQKSAIKSAGSHSSDDLNNTRQQKRNLRRERREKEKVDKEEREQKKKEQRRTNRNARIKSKANTSDSEEDDSS